MNFFVSVKESLSQSAKELKKLPSLTGASMLLALDVILSFFFRLELSQTLRVGISFVARGACGMLYGPVVLSLSAAAGDLIKYVLKPTGPYFWGFTFNAALAGLIYGLFLYKGKVSVWRVVAAKGLVNVLVNGGAGHLLEDPPVWQSVYGDGGSQCGEEHHHAPHRVFDPLCQPQGVPRGVPAVEKTVKISMGGALSSRLPFAFKGILPRRKGCTCVFNLFSL